MTPKEVIPKVQQDLFTMQDLKYREDVYKRQLEESIETVIAGYQKKNQVLSSKAKLIVSYHEIGHALVAALQTNSAPITKLTLIPRTSGALGYTMQVESEERNLMTQEEPVSYTHLCSSQRDQRSETCKTYRVQELSSKFRVP